VNVEHALTLVNTVDRTFINAGPVLNVDTWQGNDVGHANSFSD
jgi:hypothetical protein